MPQKTEIIELLQLGYDEQLRFAGSLTEEEQAVGTSEHWLPHDVLAHITEWQRRMSEELSAVRRNEAHVAEEEDIDAANAAIFASYAGYTWQEIIEAAEQAQHALLNEIAALSEENMNDPNYLSWLKGTPTWRFIAGNAFSHPMSHLGLAYIERGNREEASRLGMRTANQARRLDPSAGWQAVVAYNLACHYALMGEKDKALPLLEESLRDNPVFVAWAQQDQDLASLHGSPEFQAMIQRMQ